MDFSNLAAEKGYLNFVSGIALNRLIRENDTYTFSTDDGDITITGFEYDLFMCRRTDEQTFKYMKMSEETRKKNYKRVMDMHEELMPKERYDFLLTVIYPDGDYEP